MALFEIEARVGAARAGTLRLAQGTVQTPAFVPLASNASVRGLDAPEVAQLGYEMVLGNTFHLFITPGHERIAALGGLHRFMGWDRPIITDSGGFQVFSMGHGSVADEVKRRRGNSQSRILSIEEEGVRFRAYTDGAERFMGPETSMEVQAALGSDIALAFDECTPFHVDADYTRRSMERTHRWLTRCVDWQAEHGRDDQVLYGIVQGGVDQGMRAESVAAVAGSGVGGIAIGGTLGEDKAQMREVLGWSMAGLPEAPPRHLLGIGDVDDIVHAVGMGIDTFDCATPTRLARHGTALVPDPERRWKLDLTKAEHRDDPRPLYEGASTPHSRAYLHYLARNKELTGARILTLHNLAFMAHLMEGIRDAIRAGEWDAHAERVLAGEEPAFSKARTAAG